MIRSFVVVAALSLAFRVGVRAQEHTVIALSHSDHTVYQLDGNSGRIVNQFEAENQPHESIVSPDGNTIFVAIPQAGHVVILNAATLQEKGRIDTEYFHRSDGTSTSPHGIAITSDGNKVYIGVERAKIPGIVIYGVREDRVLGKLDVHLEGGHFLAIDPRTDKLYYPMRSDNRVLVIDTRTDRVENIIPVEGGPVGVDFTPNGEAWIHSDYDGSVTVLDTRTGEVIDRIERTGTGAGRIAVTPDGRYAASTRGGSKDVAIIDTRTREVVARVNVGGLGFPLFSPDGTKLYVMTSTTYTGSPPDVQLEASGGVTVIDMRTMTAVARHRSGVSPFGGSIRYVGGKASSR